MCLRVFSLGSVALVSVVGSTQVFMGIAFGIILTIIAPEIVKEDISRKALVRKSLLAIVMFIGLVLVS